MLKLLFVCFVVLCVVGEGIEETPQTEKREARIWSKVGLAWPGWDNDNIWALAGNGWNRVSWIYTWSAWNTEGAKLARLDFVPMLWGERSVEEFRNALSRGVFDNSIAVLAFNEPDLAVQANLSPEKAVQLWNQHIQPLKNSKRLRLGAPAVASHPQGKEWLSKFISQCVGCTIDFIPIHYYGSSGQAFIHYVTDIHNTFNKPIWVTEWACVPEGECSQQQVYDFMGWTEAWMNQQDWIERYSWFGAMRNLGGWVPNTNALLTPDGQGNTPLGVQYVTAS